MSAATPPKLTPPQLPAGVLLDMDGTVIDSEPYWIAAEQELVEKFGHTWTDEDAKSLVGNSLVDSAVILQNAGVKWTVDQILDFLLDRVIADVKQRMPWRPGAQKLLAELRSAHIPYALVTASYRSFSGLVAEAGQFDALVPGDEVTHGKPHPESYLLAAQKLGVDVTKCVAIEDSVPGIASALASGAHTIGVPCMVPIPPQPGLSRVASLTDVNLPLLRIIAGGQAVDQLAGC